MPAVSGNFVKRRYNRYLSITSFILDEEDSIDCFRTSGNIKIPKRSFKKTSTPIIIKETVPKRKTLVIKYATEIIDQIEEAEEFDGSCKREAPTVKIQPQSEAVNKVRS